MRLPPLPTSRGLSDVDFEFLYGGGDYGGKSMSLIAAGRGPVVVTRGIKGAQAWHRQRA